MVKFGIRKKILRN